MVLDHITTIVVLTWDVRPSSLILIVSLMGRQERWFLQISIVICGISIDGLLWVRIYLVSSVLPFVL